MKMREFFTLAFRAPDNPVRDSFSYFGGTRKRKVGMLSFLAGNFVASACALAALAGNTGALLGFLFLLIGVTALVPCLSFHFFSANIWQGTRLEELEITMLSREEVTVGAVLPALFISLAAGAIWLLFLIFEFFTLQGWSDPDEAWVYFSLFFIAAMGWLLSTMITLRRWLTRPGALAYLLIGNIVEWVIYSVAMIALSSTLAIFSSYWLRGNDDRLLIAFLVYTIPSLMITLSKTKEALYCPAERLFSKLDRDAFHEAWWYASEQSDEDEKEQRKEQVRKIWKHWKGMLLAALISSVLLLLLFYGSYSHQLADPESWVSKHEDRFLNPSPWEEMKSVLLLRNLLGIHSIIATATCLPALYFVILGGFYHRRKIPVLKGALFPTVWRYMAPLYTLLTVQLVIATLTGFDRSLFGMGGFFFFFGLLVPGVLLGMTIAGLSLLPSRKRMLVAAFWLFMGLGVYLVANYNQRLNVQEVVFLQVRPSGEGFMWFSGIVAIIILLFGFQFFGQRLHRLECADHTRHTWTDE